MNVRALHLLKQSLPHRVQLPLRQWLARRVRAHAAAQWPIRPDAGSPPPGWTGWPDGRPFALVLTHDVDTQRGLARCLQLAQLERERGLRSAFYFVPEGRYTVGDDLRRQLVDIGVEIGVHGLYHDWRTFLSRTVFERRAPRIRRYLESWQATGFRAPSTVRNLDWIGELGIDYDASSFDDDPFEPQPAGSGTIFPHWVHSRTAGRRYVELPYTLPQDHTLFVLLGEQGPDLWKRKLDWIAARGGMAMLIVHPDYLCLDGTPGRQEYPLAWYAAFLDYVQSTYAGRYWCALPREVAAHFARKMPEAPARSRLRIAMAAYAFYQNDNRIRRYAETLAARGDTVEIVALRRPGHSKEEMLNGVRVFQVQQRQRNERSAFSHLWRMLAFLVRSAWVLGRRSLRQSYDVVHVHTVPDFEVFAAWWPRLRGTRLILDIHDILPEFYASKFGVTATSWTFRMLLWLERLSARFADHVIISNHLWHARLIARGMPAAKCSALPNYVDPAVFFPHPRSRTDGPFTLLYPGGLQKHQGVDLAIEAFARVRDDVPNGVFHIWGDGPEKSALERRIASLGLQGRVLLHESVDLHRIPALMADADLGVVPKRADGFGDTAYSTKILEMMSQGLPVVVARTTIDQYYFPEQAVKFFTAGDADDLGRAILELFTHPDERRQLGERGRAHAAANNWEVKKGDYLKLVDALAARKGQARP